MIDMPLEDLLLYSGNNKRPDDYDDYWTRALEEMNAVDPQVELRKSKFQAPHAECYDLYFTGVGNARIYAKYIKPKQAAAPHPCVLQFHGYWGNSGDWTDKLLYAAMGYSVIAIDVRGQGGQSLDPGGVTGQTLYGHIIRGLGDHPDKMFFRNVFLDCAQIAGIAMSLPEVDPNRVGAFGYSQGGALTVACGALEPRVKRLAPVYPFLSDYKRSFEMDWVVDELTKYFRSFDPHHEREEELFIKLGYIDIQHLAHRIQGEVLWGTSLQDKICLPSTQFAAYNKIGSKKNLVLYHDYAHEQLPGMNDKIFEFMLQL
jgi:cephalosporin-C deacetylase